MPDYDAETKYTNFTYVYKDGEQVGEIKGDKLTMSKGSKPKLKAEWSYEMKRELASMGYEVREVDITTYTKKAEPTQKVKDCIGQLADLTGE